MKKLLCWLLAVCFVGAQAGAADEDKVSITVFAAASLTDLGAGLLLSAGLVG